MVVERAQKMKTGRALSSSLLVFTWGRGGNVRCVGDGEGGVQRFRVVIQILLPPVTGWANVVIRVHDGPTKYTYLYVYKRKDY